MKLVWLTDIHLNFIDSAERQKFYQEIVETQCDSVLISGDIAEAPSVVNILNEMVAQVQKPIYFVLGNHDYYRGQIQEVHHQIRALTNKLTSLFWLSDCDVQSLDSDTLLVGQDGWADGRLGDYQNSRVALNDSRMIADLFQEKILGKFQLLEKMRYLADKDVRDLQKKLLSAASKNPKRIIVVTHVPPFKESCMHNGKISDDNWLPYFSSQAMGDLLMQVAQENFKIEFLVLCGHTHSEAKYQPISNLIVEAGKAEYLCLEVQKVISI